MIYVIGSGPTGIAATTALVEAGLPVTMLDFGQDLEPEIADGRARLAARSPEDWAPGEADFLKKGMHAGSEGILLKLASGSDYPYRRAEDFSPFSAKHMDARPSLGKGGHSAVWGACALPYRDRDLANWPITARDLEPHYTAVAAALGLKSAPDDLGILFPINAPEEPELPMSLQARNLLSNLQKNRPRMRAAGVTFGRSRLAVTHEPGNGCRACAMCMYGCPYQLIYNSASTLKKLEAQSHFRYLKGYAVRAWKEVGGKVEIQAVRSETGEVESFVGDRLLVAGGPLSTTRMVLQSRQEHSRQFKAVDSQYFLFPMLLFKSTKGLERERLHTLAQLFLEVEDPAVDPHNIHLQVYTYNELYGQAVLGRVGRWGKPLFPLMRPLLNRMVVVQGYLHSDSSASISLKLDSRANSWGIQSLTCEGVEEPRSRAVILKLLRKMRGLAFSIGALPLAGQLQIAAPGRGFHYGGIFPMRNSPGEWETDTLGRLGAWQRVHLVDASVFPTVPAATITFTAMANARRIAAEIAKGCA